MFPGYAPNTAGGCHSPSSEEPLGFGAGNENYIVPDCTLVPGIVRVKEITFAQTGQF